MHTYLLTVLRIRDVYPGSRILIFTHPESRIPDLGSRIQKQQQRRGVKKKFVVIPFYVATNITKLKIILVLKCWRKTFGAIFKELDFFDPLNCPERNNMVLGSGIRKKPIPDPRSRGQKGTGSRIHNTVYWPIYKQISADTKIMYGTGSSDIRNDIQLGTWIRNWWIYLRWKCDWPTWAPRPDERWPHRETSETERPNTRKIKIYLKLF